jgi:hypothetical protein
MGNRQNLSPARNQKTTTELTPNLQPSRSQSEEFTEKYLRGQQVLWTPASTGASRLQTARPAMNIQFDYIRAVP